ncbi:MAG TPA: invasion associated locus B family protein [Bradyrhizobium sp.]|nr:invasion associated locus B family protein [Bradyrhizobium sp.]
MKYIKIAAVLACLVVTAPGQAAPPSSLPGGASSLQETYDDWGVSCSTPNKVVHCVAVQRQSRKENGQQLLMIELTPAKNADALTGALVLPFGLLLTSGVTLQIDGNPPAVPLAFRTCLPVGCIVPLSFDKTIAGALQTGTTLKITATANDTNQPVTFSVPLKGVVPALKRIKALL